MHDLRAKSIPAWCSDFCLGHAQIDLYRRKLLELAQAVLELSKNDSLEASRYQYLLNETAEISRNCTKAETKFLTKRGYSDLAIHSAEHEFFSIEIAELLCQAEDGRFDAPAFAKVLGGYVMNHILFTDLLVRPMIERP